MPENKKRYKGVLLRNRADTEGLPSIKPSISGNMIPTSFDAMQSREWVQRH